MACGVDTKQGPNTKWYYCVNWNDKLTDGPNPKWEQSESHIPISDCCRDATDDTPVQHIFIPESMADKDSKCR